MFKERFLAIFYGFSLIINIKSIQKLFFNKLVIENSRQLFNKNYALSIACRLKQQHKFIENCQKSLVRNDYIILLETMAYRNIKKYDKAWQCIKEIKSTTSEVTSLKLRTLYDSRNFEELLTIAPKSYLNNFFTNNEVDYIVKYVFNNNGLFIAKKVINIFYNDKKNELFVSLTKKLLNKEHIFRDFESFEKMINKGVMTESDWATKEIALHFLTILGDKDKRTQRKIGIKLINYLFKNNLKDLILKRKQLDKLSKTLQGKYKFDCLYLKTCIDTNDLISYFNYIEKTPEESRLKLLLFSSRYSYYKPNYELALYFSNEAKEIEPNNVAVLRSLIRVHHRLGNIKDRLLYINKLKEIDNKKIFKNEYEIAHDEYTLLNEDWYWDRQERELSKGNIVLHVLNKSLPELNGYTIRSSEIIKHQLKEGLNPVVVTKLGWTPEQQNTSRIINRIDGIEHYHLVDTESNIRLNKSPMSKYFSKFAEEFSKLVEELKPSIIHAASNFQNALAPLMVAKSYNIPSVYEVRGLWHYTQSSKITGFENSDRYQLHHKYEIKCCEIADEVVCISESLKHHLVQEGIRSDKITVVPNGVDVKKFTPQEPSQEIIKKYNLENKFVIGFIGSVTSYEGIDYLLKSLSILYNNNNKLNIAFIVVGDGPELSNLKKLTDLYGLNKIVYFVGKVPHNEVKKFYSVVDLFPFPRINEKVCQLVTPLKPYEAMAMGKLVAVSNIPALREMIHDKSTGLVFQSENSESLADCIINSTNFLSLGDKGKKWVSENRSWSVLIKKYNYIYQRALSNNTTTKETADVLF